MHATSLKGPSELAHNTFDLFIREKFCQQNYASIPQKEDERRQPLLYFFTKLAGPKVTIKIRYSITVMF